MKIAGAWVGLGLGDTSDEIRKIKAHLRKKFSYAKALSDTSAFDQQMFDVVWQMQSAYYAQGKLGKPTGIIDRATKIACGYLPPPPPVDSRPVLFTVCGTGVPWFVGPDADVARAVEAKYLWAPVGYPAATLNMNKSVEAGRQELCRLFEMHRERVEKFGAAMIGYSQGAICTSRTLALDLRPENGRLHWALPFLRKACTFGNPMRQQGCVWADAGAPPAPMTSHGIADELLTDTPSWWRDFAHKSDLYSDVEGQSGEDKTAVYKIIMGARVFQGPDNLLAQFLELSQNPAPEAIGMFKAIVDAGMFFGRGTGPHVNYSPQAAIDYLLAA